MSATGSWQQQSFAMDARINAHRASNHPNFRTQYIRRRSQLLREHDSSGYEAERQVYLKLRSHLLQQRYGVPCDQSSVRSWSARSSRISESPDRRGSIDECSSWSYKADVVTPEAESSKVSSSVEENYAFVRVHHIFDQHSAPVTMVKFANNDRSLLCCASLDGTLSICNATACPAEVIAILRGHTAGVTACDWSISNDLIASSSLDGSVRLWAVTADGISCLREVKDQLNAEMLCCLFQPVNSNLIVAGNSKGLIEVLNISTGIYPRGGSCKIGGRVQALAFDSTGTLLWAANDKGVIVSFLLGATNGRLSKCRRLSLGEQCAISCLSWRAWCNSEARDPCLLVNCAANVVYLFGIIDAEGKLLLKKRFPVRHRELQIKSTFCPIMSFRQGVCIVTGSEDCCVYFYDIGNIGTERSVCFNKLQGHSSPVLGVSFNYDESLLATSDQQGLVILWNRGEKKNSLST